MATLPNIPPIPDQDRYIFLAVTSSTSAVDVTFPVFGTQEDLTVLVNFEELPDTAWTFTSASGIALGLLPLPITDGVVTLNTPVGSGTIEIIGDWQARQVIQPTAPGIARREFNQTVSTLIASLREVQRALRSAMIFDQTDTAGDGFYNAASSLISNIADPVSAQDAVNLETLNAALTDIVSNGGGAMLTSWPFTGDGHTMQFSIPLADAVLSNAPLAYLVTVNGLVIDPSLYSINNTAQTISFTQAPINGGDIQVRMAAYTRAVSGISTTEQAIEGTDDTTYMSPLKVAQAVANDLTVFLSAAQTFGGTLSAPTAAPGTNNGEVATTAFVSAAVQSAVTPGAIFGLIPSSISGSSTTASMTVSAGAATDASAAASIVLPNAVSWSVTNGNAANGCADGGTLQNSSTYHMYACLGARGVCLYASRTLGMSAASAPAGYNSYVRRIFSFTTTNAGAPIPYTADEVGGGAMMAYLASPTTDVNGASMSTASRTLYTLNVPVGVKLEWMGISQINRDETSTGYWLTSPDEPDSPSGSTGATTLFDQGVDAFNFIFTSTSRRRLITNASGQIGIRGSAASLVYVMTTGWVDARRS